jgi:TRAP-type transport system small permease protein
MACGEPVGRPNHLLQARPSTFNDEIQERHRCAALVVDRTKGDSLDYTLDREGDGVDADVHDGPDGHSRVRECRAALRLQFRITFSEEVSRFLFMWVVFLGAVLTLRDNGHLGVHMFTKLLPFAGKRICKLISDVTTLACCGLITHGGWSIVKLEIKNVAPISEIPLGAVFTGLLVCSIGMGILLIGSIWRNLKGEMGEAEMCPDFEDVM